ncbi:hypothetical protein CgunFtcFv8_018354 [Champsocephalus gunnari]|uniref:Uncharacterized protein n=1 Tax=Champsocephalus gunnari TaxID=52237 RepID=A0AAN8BSN4_CHAGU|nr:hypothetical protein CgunFtcFv8_018354 [Champsocephalus gunnari]
MGDPPLLSLNGTVRRGARHPFEQRAEEVDRPAPRVTEVSPPPFQGRCPVGGRGQRKQTLWLICVGLLGRLQAEDLHRGLEIGTNISTVKEGEVLFRFLPRCIWT